MTWLVGVHPRRTDRITTFTEYADVGIPAYRLIDLAPSPVLMAYVLVDGVYEYAAEGSVEVGVLTPTELTIHVERLRAGSGHHRSGEPAPAVDGEEVAHPWDEGRADG